MSNFKLIFISVFAVAAVFGILVFSGIISVGGGTTTTTDVQGTVTIWGTFDNNGISGFVEDFDAHNPKIHITYVQKDSASFDTALTEAIASGTPPDLVLLPDNLVWRFQDKLTHVPFASLPAQTFQTTFVSSANIFSVSDGTLAIPWASDPLVMYYNRDLLQAAGIAQPPTTWQGFIGTIPLLAKKQSDLTLTQMGAALGAYGNIAHAKDMLALLFLQSGNAFITASDNRPLAHFGSASGTEAGLAIAAINFYMAFSDPLKQIYTWNAGEPLDRDLFVQSKLAYYFGTASDLPLIRAQNPNLNFSVAMPPQTPTSTPQTTGHVYGFAIPKTAPNQLLSYTATTLLANATSEASIPVKLGSSLALMPVRRDVLSQKPVADAYLGLLYTATLLQRSWLDPNPSGTDTIFGNLVRDISSSVLPVDQALGKAAAQIGALGATI